MIYKSFKEESLSRLGLGNMRLPTDGHGRDAKISREEAGKIVDYAITHGINYFDTAYVYNNGDSEKFLGEALPKYPRESYNIATKYNCHSGPDYKAVFAEQLERLNVEYFDFYLLHALMEGNVDTYLNNGCIDFFLEQKAKGKIRNLGFSSHASVPVLEKFADHHQWDFAQIQLNYLDWTLTDAKGQYEALTKRGIPVVVMEPVRGGRLASLSASADALLKAAHPDWSISSWAFRWLMRLDNVQVILSGMSNLDQIIDNVSTFETFQPLSDEDAALLDKACELFRGEISIPCTACRYCCEPCPMGIDIPEVMSTYNEFKLSGGMALMGLNRLDKGPADCIACGNCAAECPQSIAIPDIMAELAEEMKKMPPRP